MAPSGIDSRDQAKWVLYVVDVVQKCSFSLLTERIAPGVPSKTFPELYLFTFRVFGQRGFESAHWLQISPWISRL